MMGALTLVYHFLRGRSLSIFNFNLMKILIYSDVDSNNNSNAKCTVFIEGPETAAEVNYLLAREGLEDKFPLFTAVHRLVMHRGFQIDFFTKVQI